MSEFFVEGEGTNEGEDSQSVERQALDDATHEPGAYVEQTRDIEQSEAVQKAFEVVVEAASEANAPEEAAAPDRAGRAASEPAEATPARAAEEQEAASGEAQQPVQEIEFQKPDVGPGRQQEKDLPEGGPGGPGNILQDIDDLMSGGSHDGLKGDPFEQGGPLPSGDGSRGGLFDGDGMPAPLDPHGMIDDVMGASGLEGKGPGRIGGGPGVLHPKYDHGQGSDGGPEKPKPPGSGQGGGTSSGSGGQGSGSGQGGGTSSGSGGQGSGSGGQGTSTSNKKPPAGSDNSGADVRISGTFYTPEAIRKLELAGFRAVANGDTAAARAIDAMLGIIYLGGGIVWDKSGGKMGHPDGSDEEGGPAPKDLDADDVNKAQAGGILVSDPAFTQGGLEGRQLLGTKWPGLVIDYGYEGGKQPLSGGIKAGAEQVSDPAEPEAGTTAASKASRKASKSDKDAVLDDQDGAG